MKKFRDLIILSVAIMSLSFAAVAQSAVSSNVASSRSIEQKAFKKLLGLPYYSVFDHINFTFDNGTLVLGGKVYSNGTKSQAARAVKDIDGVTNVINNIEQLPASPYDDRIRRAALRTFNDRGPSRYFTAVNPEVRIIVENGRITLEGYVANSGDKNLLNVLANGISGVFGVTNNLVVGKRAV